MAATMGRPCPCLLLVGAGEVLPSGPGFPRGLTAPVTATAATGPGKRHTSAAVCALTTPLTCIPVAPDGGSRCPRCQERAGFGVLRLPGWAGLPGPGRFGMSDVVFSRAGSLPSSLA